MRLLAAAAVVALTALTGCNDTETHIKTKSQPATAPIVAAPKPQPVPEADFDFYVLALSWSPSYCEAEGSSANPQQCNAKRPYGFVVHGLWPQFEQGFPTDCATDAPRVPDDLVRSLYDIMPSAGLIGHQWRRHGSCSGLVMDDYFATLRAARQKVAIPSDYLGPDVTQTVDPKDVEARFIEANQNLAPGAISIDCEGGYLAEVRICLTKQLAFRSCQALERRFCRRRRSPCRPFAAKNFVKHRGKTMPKLLYSGASPYSAKVRAVAAHAGVSLDEVSVDTNADPQELLAANPLGKIPTLVTDDGEAVFDSRAITQYLNRLSGGKLFPRNAAKRLEAERLEALADGICDCLLAIVYERRFRPEEKIHQPWIDRQWEKAARGLDVLIANPPKLPKSIHAGHIAVRAMIGYLDLRFAGKWEKGRTKLKRWAARFDEKFPQLAGLMPSAPK